MQVKILRILITCSLSLFLLSCQTAGRHGENMADGYAESVALAEKCPDYEVKAGLFDAAMVVCLTSKRRNMQCEMEAFLTSVPSRTEHYKRLYAQQSQQQICSRANELHRDGGRSFLVSTKKS